MFRKLLSFLFVIFVFSNSAISADDFYTYVKNIKKETEKVWNPPVYYKKYTSMVNFRVNKDGSTSNVKLVKSSRISQLDKRAVETIKNLPKFNKLPSFYLGDYIEVTVALTNYIQADLKNPNVYQKKKNIKQDNIVPVNTKNVKIVKVLYPEFFYSGESNFEDNMKKMVLNLDIQRSTKSMHK